MIAKVGEMRAKARFTANPLSLKVPKTTSARTVCQNLGSNLLEPIQRLHDD
jgi:hypothetical protein